MPGEYKERLLGLSGAKDLCNKSTCTYREYLGRLNSHLLESDRRQIALDIPRTIISVYRYVLGQEHADEECDLAVEPAQQYMDAAQRIVSAYCIVRLSLSACSLR